MIVHQAPCLVVGELFGIDLCRELIGFMREKRESYPTGTREKNRYHEFVEDDERLDRVNARIRDLVPIVATHFQFRIAEVERPQILMYTFGSRFSPHFDNGNPVLEPELIMPPQNTIRYNCEASHMRRRFALTVQLNEDFDGGLLRFPAEDCELKYLNVGDAAVFSCSVIHEITKIEYGHRFALTSFFY